MSHCSYVCFMHTRVRYLKYNGRSGEQYQVKALCFKHIRHGCSLRFGVVDFITTLELQANQTRQNPKRFVTTNFRYWAERGVKACQLPRNHFWRQRATGSGFERKGSEWHGEETDEGAHYVSVHGLLHTLVVMWLTEGNADDKRRISHVVAEMMRRHLPLNHEFPVLCDERLPAEETWRPGFPWENRAHRATLRFLGDSNKAVSYHSLAQSAASASARSLELLVRDLQNATGGAGHSCPFVVFGAVCLNRQDAFLWLWRQVLNAVALQVQEGVHEDVVEGTVEQYGRQRQKGERWDPTVVEALVAVERDEASAAGLGIFDLSSKYAMPSAWLHDALVRYYFGLRQAFSGTRAVSVAMDGARVGTTEYLFATLLRPSVESADRVSGWAPPQVGA